MNQNWTDYNVTYDAIVEIIQRLQNLDERTDENDLRTIRVALAHISRLGAMHASEAEKDFLTRDIVQLFDSDEDESFLDLVDEFDDAYAALAFGNHPFIPCKSFKKHCKKLLHNIARFARHHKKELIIGAVAAVAIGATAYVIAGALAEAATTAAAGAAAVSSESGHHSRHAHESEPPPLEQPVELNELPMPEVFEDPASDPNFKENAKYMAARAVHDIWKFAGETGSFVHGIVEDFKKTATAMGLPTEVQDSILNDNGRNWEQFVADGHEMIDRWFDSSLAQSYTNRVEIPFLTPKSGEIPPVFIGALKEASEIAKTAKNLTQAEEAAALISESRAATALQPTGIWELNGKNIKRVDWDQLYRPERIKHIFEPDKHQLHKLGLTPKETYEKITHALVEADNLGQITMNKPFKINIQIDSHMLEVRGNVIDGELRIGTFFIPK